MIKPKNYTIYPKHVQSFHKIYFFDPFSTLTFHKTYCIKT